MACIPVRKGLGLGLEVVGHLQKENLQLQGVVKMMTEEIQKLNRNWPKTATHATQTEAISDEELTDTLSDNLALVEKELESAYEHMEILQDESDCNTKNRELSYLQVRATVSAATLK